MALTLVESAKLALNGGRVQDSAFIEQFARTSDLLQALPFVNINGNSYAYNTEDTLPGIGYRGINEAFSESTGVVNPQTEALKIAGGDLDVDTFLVNTQGSQVRSTHELMKAKALSLALTRDFIKGDSTTNPRSVDGLQVRLTGTQLIANQSGEGALKMSKLDEAIDAVDNPTHIIMNKAMRRRLSAASKSNSLSGTISFSPDAFGRQAAFYNDLPILIADYDNAGNQILPFTEAGNGSGTASTSIYVVSFQEGGVVGLQGAVSGVYGISTRDLGELETKPVFRTRLEWYVAMAILNGRSAARLYGVTDAAAVA